MALEEGAQNEADHTGPWHEALWQVGWAALKSRRQRLLTLRDAWSIGDVNADFEKQLQRTTEAFSWCSANLEDLRAARMKCGVSAGAAQAGAHGGDQAPFPQLADVAGHLLLISQN